MSKSLDLVLSNCASVVVRQELSLVPVDSHHPPLLITAKLNLASAILRSVFNRSRVTLFNFRKADFDAM